MRQHTPVVEIRGTIDDIDVPCTVYVWAASPRDANQSFTGSGLPFPNADVAFGNNSIVLKDWTRRDFKVTLLEPNAFYDRGGSVYIPPTIFAKAVSQADHMQ